MTTTTTARDGAPETDLSDWLINPPWRQPKPKAARKKAAADTALAPLVFSATALAPQLAWDEALLPIALKQPRVGTEDEQLSALGFWLDNQTRDVDPEHWEGPLADLRAALAAQDAEGVVQHRAALKRGLGWRPAGVVMPVRSLETLWGNADKWLCLGPLAAPVWNLMAASILHHNAADFVPALGVAGLPGLRAWAQRSFPEAFGLVQCVGDEALARVALDFAFSGSPHAPLAKAWLLRWPQYAVSAHLADALSGSGKAHTQARALLRWLDAQGHGDVVRAEAQRFDATRPNDGQPGLVQAATQALLDAPGFELHPTRIAPLPAFWQPQNWGVPLMLRSGLPLPAEAWPAVGEMLSFSRELGVYAGLHALRAQCTAESLDAFVWRLLQAWNAAGAPPKLKWAFTSLALWGSGETARQLEKLVRFWPSDGASARAALGLEVLADFGSDEALACIAAIGERVKSRPLKEKAKAMMERLAMMRGLSAADLQDRLVPDLGLNQRGERVLDFGPRQFLLRLDEALKPRLNAFENGVTGARVAKLPAVGARDDAQRANEATAQYKLIAKQAKAIATSQLRRLEAAMREQRRWSKADFEAVYVRHPVLRQLAARLIWGVFAQEAGVDAADERVLGAFRVNAEGELVTSDDAPFVWPDAAASVDGGTMGKAPRMRVGLLHPLQMSAEQRQAFAQVLADYELLQPFEQLGREVTPGLTRAGHAEAVQVWRGRSFEPLRLLGLSSRGWQTDEHSGEIMGWVRALPGGRHITLQVTPGVPLFAPKDAGPQQLEDIFVAGPGLSGNQDWAALDAISVGELLRDLGQVSA